MDFSGLDMSSRLLTGLILVLATLAGCAATCDRSNITPPKPAPTEEPPRSVAQAVTENDADSEQIELARKIYAAKCATCHGDTGRGDGPAAAALFPKPKNFADPKVVAMSDQQLFDVIKNGKPNTSMAPFSAQLSDDDIRAVVALIRTWTGPAPTPAPNTPDAE